MMIQSGFARLRGGNQATNENSVLRFHLKARLPAVLLAVGIVFAGIVLFAQDKYTVKVPGGLAFSEFKGYEEWQAISISRNEKAVAVILGNPAMIHAYRAGIPRNGKPV